MAGTTQTCSAGRALDTVREALHTAGQPIRPRGADAFMASCPLHTDHTPSLSVTWRESTPAGRGGAVLLHCFSCQSGAADIASALGLRMADLFDNPAPPPAQPQAVARRRRAHRPARSGPLPPRITVDNMSARHQWRKVRVYTYTSADGRAVQQVIRQECSCGGRTHKRFQQRYRHDRRWVYRKPADFTPELYRAGAIAAAARAQSWVWITEGEKDADTLTSLGRLATTNAQGAASFPPALLSQFTGLRVAIVADRDLAGYQRAATLYEHLRNIAAHVVVLVAALDSPKADVTDHLSAGLWKPDEPFGGLIEITFTDLAALRAAAAARDAADLFTVAIAEAQAHQHRQTRYANSAGAAARWLSEAAHQLHTLRRSDRELHYHTTEHPSPIASTAAETVAALRASTEDTWRHRAPRDINEPAARRSTRQPAA